MASARALLAANGCELSFTSARACMQHHALAVCPRLGSPTVLTVAPRIHSSCRGRLAPIRYRHGDDLPARAPVPAANFSPDSTGPAAVPAAPKAPTAHAQLKVIGLGLRGISAVNRLIGCGSLPEAEFWALDSDKRVLATADPTTHVLEVGPGDDASLGPGELQALSGGAAVPAAPEAPDGHAGAVFVLGSAFGSPGGAPMLLQLVRHLRRCGYFVAAALTRPFEFEGSRRLEAADTLISTMEEVAHLVVVIAQGVLTRASAELTMGQAEAIADNTLVYTVQSTLWALRAPEVLKVSHGAFLWHGRDLRNIRRPLFPPMMNLLSCPGHATLGRGQAALPLPLLQQAGLASALSTLAEDAVKAASESPFLDNKLDSSTGVLCVLRVPPSALGVTSSSSSGGGGGMVGAGGGGGPLVADNQKEYALRSAVQVAAMTVRDLVGSHCHDIIVCPQLCHDLEEGAVPPGATAAAAGEGGAEAEQHSQQGRSSSGGAGVLSGGQQPQQQKQGPVAAASTQPLVRVEVSLLVLERIEEAAEPKAIAGHKSTGDSYHSMPTATSHAGGGYAAPAPAAPTAATARDRMGSVLTSRSPVAAKQRRLPRPGAPTPTASYFSGHLPQPAATTPSTAPGVHGASVGAGAGPPAAAGGALTGGGPAYGGAGASGSVGAGVSRAVSHSTQSARNGALTGNATAQASPGAPGSSAVHGTSAVSTGGPSSLGRGSLGSAAHTAQVAAPATTAAAVPPNAASPPSAEAAAAAAAAAAIAENNRARKQARLAAMSAMSALAGGTAGGSVGGGVGAAGSSNHLHTAAGAPGVRGGQGGTAAGHHAAPVRAPGLGAAMAAAAAAGGPGVPLSTWSAGAPLSTRGYPQQHQQQQHQPHAPQQHHVAKQPYQPHYQQQHQHQHQRFAPVPPSQEAAGQGSGHGNVFGVKQIPRLSENLVTSLVAQSLDLPPQAARWRHQHRVQPAGLTRNTGSTVFHLPTVEGELHDEEDTWLEDTSAGGAKGEGLGRGLQQFIMGMRLPGSGGGAAAGAGGGATGPVAVRSRVAGMLDIERKDLWEGA